jgi:hypothetical protein
MYFEERFWGHSKLEIIRDVYGRDNPDFCDRARDALCVAIEFCNEPMDGSVLYASASGTCCVADDATQCISIVTWFDRPRQIRTQ